MKDQLLNLENQKKVRDDEYEKAKRELNGLKNDFNLQDEKLKDLLKKEDAKLDDDKKKI